EDAASVAESLSKVTASKANDCPAGALPLRNVTSESINPPCGALIVIPLGRLIERSAATPDLAASVVLVPSATLRALAAEQFRSNQSPRSAARIRMIQGSALLAPLEAVSTAAVGAGTTPGRLKPMAWLSRGSIAFCSVLVWLPRSDIRPLAF